MVKIELGKWDSIWVVVSISLVSFGFVYGYGSSDPAVMGHSVSEMEGVCLTNGTGCDGVRAYVDFVTLNNNTACSWHNGQVCPVEDGVQFNMVGYSSTQVLCCGTSNSTCSPYDWTTYYSACTAVCPPVQCGSASGTWRHSQRRLLAAGCQIEERTVTGAPCAISCGSCGFGEGCVGGVCQTMSCFVAETLIDMADMTQKAIEDIVVGDEVIGYDLDKNEKVSAVVGRLESPVRAGFYNVELESGKVLGVTNEHPMYIKKLGGEIGWGSLVPEASEADGMPGLLKMEEGDMIFSSDLIYDKILKISYIEGPIQVYNLKDVGENSNFFADGLLAHNK